jgi:nucleotidyltransferase/DNA polymerase involved in DNA repair
MSRILIARFAHLGLIAAWRRHPELRNEPVVVGGEPVLRLPVLAASAAAEAAGVRPGQPLRQAQQLCPAAVFVALDGGMTERLRAAALDALCAEAPAVELGDAQACCDISGRHVRHRTEAAWAAAVARALTAALGGEAPSVGVAGSRFVAWTAAGKSAPRHIRRVPPGEEAAFLAPLPIGLLPVDGDVLARLSALGLDCLGAVAGLHPADLQRQFGDDGLVAHRYARGEDDVPVTPESAPRTLAERLILDGPVADREAIRFCARRVCDSLGDRLRRRGLVAERLDLVLECDAGTAATASRVPPVAAGSAEELWPVVLGLLGAAEPVAPVTALRLEASRLGAARGRQVDLWRRGDAAHDAVARTVARLGDRFGAQTVLRPRLALDPGDIPERRFSWVPGSAAAEPVPVGSQR